MSGLALVTERMVLRGFEERDRGAFRALNADLEVMRFFAAPMTFEQSDEALDRYRGNQLREGFSMFAAEMLGTGEFAGVIGMQTLPYVIPEVAQPTVEIGWRLRKQMQGMGLATEGARAVVEYAFEVVGLDEVVAVTTPVNLPSRRVMEKVGMTWRKGLEFAHPRVPEGHEFSEHVVYGITREEWMTRRSLGS